MAAIDGLGPWVVLYRDSTLLPASAPLAFECWAEDGDHAEEQCVNAYPDCRAVWTYLGDQEAAYRDYYRNNEGGGE